MKTIEQEVINCIKYWNMFFFLFIRLTVTAFEEKKDVLETLKGHTYGPSTEITAISVSVWNF